MKKFFFAPVLVLLLIAAFWATSRALAQDDDCTDSLCGPASCQPGEVITNRCDEYTAVYGNGAENPPTGMVCTHPLPDLICGEPETGSQPADPTTVSVTTVPTEEATVETPTMTPPPLTEEPTSTATVEPTIAPTPIWEPDSTPLHDWY